MPWTAVLLRHFLRIAGTYSVSNDLVVNLEHCLKAPLLSTLKRTELGLTVVMLTVTGKDNSSLPEMSSNHFLFH